MRNCLRYSINEHLYVEATVDDSKDLENFKMLTLRLYTENEHVVIAKKRFLWPEQHLPNDITMDDERQTIILKGTGNIAKVPVRIRHKNCSLYIGTSEDFALFTSIYASLSSSLETESVDSLAKIFNCLSQEDWSTTWTVLLKLAGKANADSCDHLPITIPAHMQVALIKILRKHSDEKHFDRVLAFVIRSRLITTSRASIKLIELLVDEGLIPQVCDFVQSSLFLDARTYAICLKMSSNGSDSESLNLLLALLEKPINCCGLRRAIPQNLTECEVMSLTERLVSLSCDKKRGGSFDKILKLEAVLADSHLQRFIWDETCHSKIQNVACFVATMAQLMDQFFHLEQRLEQNEKFADDNAEINSDYTIRKITFIQKSI